MEQHSKNSILGSFKIPSADLSTKVESTWGLSLGADASCTSRDASLFSSSLPVLPHEKLNLNDTEQSGQTINEGFPMLIKLNQEDESKGPLEDIQPHAVGSLLPGDEDDLLAGVMDDFDLSELPTQVEDLDDDLFGSGGGMEMDFEPHESVMLGMSNLSMSDGVPSNGVSHYTLPNGMGTVAGEHPYGEHPSRTLFVRNINSNVEDSELRILFEQFGDIRMLYTACKHRGFVMIGYYDIRAARTAMRALQNKPLRRRKLDIHFSIPKDNPSEKDINQGTLVVFNLDASVSNDDLRQIFGAYGEVKEIRETPNKRHHKFIEFYDVRGAEAALKALNRCDIAGKRIKLEPSRPGGARRSLMQQLSQELEQDEARTFWNSMGSPVTTSPPGAWPHFSSPVEHSPLQSLSQSPGLGTFSPRNNNHLPGLASVLPSQASNPAKIAPIGKEQGRVACLNQFLWGSPTNYSEHITSSAWPTSSGVHASASSEQGQNYMYSGQHGSFFGSHPHHHVGSAPSGIPLDRHFNYFPGSPETSFTSPVSFSGVGLRRNPGNYVMNVDTFGAMNASVALPGHLAESGSTGSRMMSFPRNGPIFFGNSSYQGIGVPYADGFTERGRSRGVEYSSSQIDNKKQYQLDLDKIKSGEDTRTTLMIKNIPNKYTSKMLLAAIDENHRGTYDFLYLPIDFKNKCNVGYAFINMVSPSHIISFYEAFNGKKWEKFNSEKVASLAYARIQGKPALVTHFQNSSLMNEDKRCRPILFQSEGQETGDQELFFSSNLNICIRQPDGSYSGDSLESPKSNVDEKPEKN